MPIDSLPVLAEQDLEREKELAELRRLPESVVVRYGTMGNIAELRYEATERPGCGTRVVARTPRGVELAVVLTTTCPNGGCGHNLSRKQMLAYIDRSGGKQYPFTNDGKVLRIATPEDIHEQAHLDANRSQYSNAAKQYIRELDLPMKLVDTEALLGGDRIVFHFMSEGRIDFRELVRRLAADFHTRIEMRQVGSRDEARLVADYEKCGQHCCCKQFLKVLKPVSMRSAKIQKATLDPSKISGRCGRLMCCLRYEDATYDDLRKRLPPRNTRLLTPDGPAIVFNTQILTQLVMVELESNHTRAAYPVEELEKLKGQPIPEPGEIAEQQREARSRDRTARQDQRRRDTKAPTPLRDEAPPADDADLPAEQAELIDDSQPIDQPAVADTQALDADGKPKRKRRRRRRRKGGGGGGGGESGGSQ